MGSWFLEPTDFHEGFWNFIIGSHSLSVNFKGVMENMDSDPCLLKGQSRCKNKIRGKKISLFTTNGKSRETCRKSWQVSVSFSIRSTLLLDILSIAVSRKWQTIFFCPEVRVITHLLSSQIYYIYHKIDLIMSKLSSLDSLL